MNMHIYIDGLVQERYNSSAIDGLVQERRNSSAIDGLMQERRNSSAIDELVQERGNSIANALELRLSCTNLSISPMHHVFFLTRVMFLTHDITYAPLFVWPE